MKRASGILLHLSSLPSEYGIGDLGPQAYGFCDFLSQTGQSYWQILPINPTRQIYGNSPYSSTSTFAGNILFISPQLLREEGLLCVNDLKSKSQFNQQYCDYVKAATYKLKLLNLAYENFKLNSKNKSQYEQFCSQDSAWLKDFALFEVIKRHFRQKPWSSWEEDLRDRYPGALAKVTKIYAKELEKEKFFQYLFFRQWVLLKVYCRKKNIQLIGDLPIYPSYDSAEVWSNPEIFKLGKNKQPVYLAGVPPDYFSKTGQLWGNPVYNWEVLKNSGYEWWLKRLSHNFRLFDLTRIDHFRGLVAFWEVPAGETTAVKGKWQKVPFDDFFQTLGKHFPSLPIIAEDLGLITQDVIESRLRFKLPGMKVLLFAFTEDNPRHPYLPHNYERNFVVYTGTHDNNTIKGWFEQEATPKDKLRLFSYLGRRPEQKELHWELIRLAQASVAKVSIFPLQDVLGLGKEARMNTPSTAKGNWQWRFKLEQLSPKIIKKLFTLTRIYGRI